MFKKLLIAALFIIGANAVRSTSAAPVYIPENSTVTLQWDYATGANLASYKLYRDGTVFSPLVDGYIRVITNANGLDTFQFVTTSLPAGVYDFTLTAINLAGVESDPSNHVEVSALPKPVAPQSFRAKR